MLIEINNQGQDIVSTNYWATDHAKAGLLYLSVNAGAFRLLLPSSQQAMLKEMSTGKKVLIESSAAALQHLVASISFSKTARIRLLRSRWTSARWTVGWPGARQFLFQSGPNRVLSCVFRPRSNNRHPAKNSFNVAKRDI